MDNEIKGTGNSINYKYRVHDPRIGRFLSIDPLTKKYPMYSPYHFSSNQPIHAPELEGLESHQDLNCFDPNFALADEKGKQMIRNAQGIAGAVGIGSLGLAVAWPAISSEIALLSGTSWSTLPFFQSTAFTLGTKFTLAKVQDIGEQVIVQSINNGGNYAIAFENVDYFNAFIKGISAAAGMPKPVAEGLKTMVDYKDGKVEIKDDFSDILSEYGIRMSIGSLKPKGMDKGFEVLFNIGNKGTRSQITIPFSNKLDKVGESLLSPSLIETEQDDYKVKVDKTNVDMKKIENITNE